MVNERVGKEDAIKNHIEKFEAVRKAKAILHNTEIALCDSESYLRTYLKYGEPCAVYKDGKSYHVIRNPNSGKISITLCKDIIHIGD